MRNMPQLQDQRMPEKHWFAVYTFFRREKSAVAYLRKLDIECFIPLINQTKKYERKVKHYSIPLINHYIFVYIKATDFNKVLSCRDVIRLVQFGNGPSPVPKAEIDILKRVSGEKALVAVESLRPKSIGQEVEIIQGNLAGLTGRLIQIKNNNQVLIDLNHIGYSIKLEVHVSAVSVTNKTAFSDQ